MVFLVFLLLTERYHFSCTYLVKGEISYFLYLSRKRRDFWIVICFLRLSLYLAENAFYPHYKDQFHKCTYVLV
jgi:hypothetical protein